MNYRIKNVGRSVANEAVVHARLFVIDIEGDPTKSQKELCENIANEPRTAPIAIFQGEPATAVSRIYTVTKDPDLIESLKQYKLPMAALAGCIDYVFGEPATHHQTGFIYWVMLNDPAKANYPVAVTIGEDIPINKLVLVKYPSGGDYAN